MWFLFFVAFFIVVITFLLNKKIYNPVFLFSLTWTLVLFLATINLYDIKYSDNVFIVILIMLISFPLGSIAYSTLKNNKNILTCLEKTSQRVYEPKKIIFLSLCVFSSLILLIDELEIIRLILRGANYIDIIVQSGGAQTVEISGLKGLIYIFIVYPIVYASSPICAIEVVSGSKDKLIYLLINIILVILNSAHHGGRIGILFFVIAYIFSFLIYNKKFYLSKITKRIIILFSIIGFALIMWLSKSRGIENIWESFYMYFVCNIPVFDGFANNPAFSSHTWGFLSLNGFLYPVMALVRVFGLSVPATYMYTQTIRQFLESNWVYISSYGHGVNAFLPAGGYWYIDGGYLLEFFAIFITGMMCKKSYIDLCMKFDKRKCAIYLLVVTGILLSFIRYYLTSYQFVLALFYLLFLYKKKK
ncbi:oligosaccharide repeat unit polymerase [[Clostridium] spiroforme]|nr:oligosaccharide repeat unit polymerase [Thomasclavelia spiroformis]